MAINSLKKAAISAISKNQLDLKKNYRIERTIKQIKSPILMSKYKKWNYKVFVGNREILTRVFVSKKRTEENTIIFFHGGGWVTENIDSYNYICKQISKNTNCIVISVDYRLAPEYPFPQGLDDCYEVTKVAHEKQKNNLFPGKIILMGDSAGANLAAAIALKARDTGEFKVDTQILLYPVTYWDHSATSPFDSVRENGRDYLLTDKRINDYIDLYKRNNEDLTNPYFSPLMADDFSNQPKTLIITAEFDPLRDEGEEYGTRLLEAGNKVKIYRLKDALHGFISLGSHNEYVRKTYELINYFLNERD